jgi:hypothetical protein
MVPEHHPEADWKFTYNDGGEVFFTARSFAESHRDMNELDGEVSEVTAE